VLNLEIAKHLMPVNYGILHRTPKVVDTFLMPKNDNQLP
jgi:hypothetical protein